MHLMRHTLAHCKLEHRYKSLSTCCSFAGEIQYGGRVTDDYDKRLLNTFARVWFSEAMFHSSYRFYKGYVIPQCKTIGQYLDYIQVRRFFYTDVPRLSELLWRNICVATSERWKWRRKYKYLFLERCRKSNNVWLRSLMQSDCLYSSLFFEHYNRILLLVIELCSVRSIDGVSSHNAFRILPRLDQVTN